ncbi:MAG: DegQ family serine endoprotease [Nitrospira sp.]|nr:DegQ family serine endoprotease [Nitrospira sp.]
MRVQRSLTPVLKNPVVLAIGSFICVCLALGASATFFQPSTVTQASEEQVAPSVQPAVVQPAAFALSSTSEDLLRFNQHLIAIAKKVKPAVVNISIVKTSSPRSSPFPHSPFFDDPFFRKFFGDRFREERRQEPRRRQQGMGSGVIVNPDGYIVTNNHVVAEGDEIQVVLGDQRKFEAKLIGTDPKTDLAIVKIEASGLPFLSWGDSSTLEVGEMVVAVGNPFGLNQTVTMGIISAVGRAGVGLADYEDFIQTDAAINPGNSGGALVNLRGELIGINTAIFTRSGGYMGIGFAIPSDMAKGVARSLEAHGKVVRGWLGVSIQDLTPDLAKQFEAADTKGALVTDVVEGSPAEDARFRRGDIIREFDGRLVENSTKLRTYVAETPPETKVDVRILREGKKKRLTVVIGQMPKDMAGPGDAGTVGVRHVLSGMTVESVASGSASDDRGVRVLKVEPDSRADRAGIRKDDVILEINRMTIKDVDDFDRVTGWLEEDDSVLVLLRRGRSMLFLSLGGR